MYAVEHENESGNDPSKYPDCEFYNRNKQRCEKWNSGYPKCESHRCRYYNPTTRRHTVCSECAYCYGNKCYHQQAPSKHKLKQDEGSFCSFFCSEKKNPKKYKYIRINCERLVVSQKLKDCNDAIRKKTKYIKRATNEVNQPTTTENTRNALQKGIKSFNTEIAELTKQRARYEERVNKLGGCLKKLPWFEN